MSITNRFRHALAILTLTVVAAACGGDDGPSEPKTPPTPEFNGTWQTSNSGLTLTLTTIESADGSISGNGTAKTSTESLALTVTGVHSHPDVTFTGKATGFEDWNFTGQFVGSNTVSGTLNGSGFDGDAATWTRQAQ